MKKRIVHFGPRLDQNGGVVTVIDSIMSLDLSEEFNIENIGTTRINNKIFEFIKSIFHTTKKLINKEIDIAHIHMASNGSFYRKSIIALLCKAFNVPIIIHMHGACFKEFYNSMNKITKKYFLYVFRKVDKVIVLTKSWKNFFLQFIDESKIDIVSNFTFLPNDNCKEISIKKDKIEILFLGRLGKRKGTYDLIDAAEVLKNRNNKFKIILAGDGEIERCKEIISQKELHDFIDVVGWIGKEEKVKYLKESDILVLPSYFESFGLSLIEAMSYKIPVIASWGGEMSEVVRDGIDGMLITPGNVEELADKIEILIKDDDIRKKFSEKGYKRVIEKFSSEIATEKLKNIYLDLLG